MLTDFLKQSDKIYLTKSHQKEEEDFELSVTSSDNE